MISKPRIISSVYQQSYTNSMKLLHVASSSTVFTDRHENRFDSDRHRVIAWISQSVNQSISVKKIGSRGTKLRKI